MYYIQSIQQFVDFAFSDYFLFLNAFSAKMKVNDETIKSGSFSTFIRTAMTERKETTRVRMIVAQKQTFNEMIDD